MEISLLCKGVSCGNTFDQWLIAISANDADSVETKISIQESGSKIVTKAIKPLISWGAAVMKWQSYVSRGPMKSLLT